MTTPGFPHLIPLAQRLLLVLLTLAGVAGCAATIEPLPVEPGMRAVFLLEHGRTSSLVLAREDGTLIRYAYGDWLWYAKKQTGFLRAFPTLFTETTATLGRRELSGPPTADNLRRQVPGEIAELYILRANPIRVDALICKLDTLFHRHSETLIYNESYDFEFVIHPEPYSLWHNSNHLVAEWLRHLGIGVSGTPIFGYWRTN